MPSLTSLFAATVLLTTSAVWLDRESTAINDPVLWGVKEGLMPCVFGPSERAQAVAIAAIPLTPRPAIVPRDQLAAASKH